MPMTMDRLTAEQVRRKEQAAIKPVKVINASKQLVVKKYDNDEYRFRPGEGMMVAAAAAWVWFGDPDARQDKDRWNQTVRHLMNANGCVDNEPSTDKNWKLIRDGQFHCPTFGTGEKGYYDGFGDTPKNVNESVPLSELGIEADLVPLPQRTKV